MHAKLSVTKHVDGMSLYHSVKSLCSKQEVWRSNPTCTRLQPIFQKKRKKERKKEREKNM